jgi:hypothetical protein
LLDPQPKGASELHKAVVEPFREPAHLRSDTGKPIAQIAEDTRASLRSWTALCRHQALKALQKADAVTLC